MPRVVKMTVSVPPDLYRAVEAERRLRRVARSTVIGEALATWLRARDRARKASAYVRAYRRHPPDTAEIADQKAWVTSETWSRQGWK